MSVAVVEMAAGAAALAVALGGAWWAHRARAPRAVGTPEDAADAADALPGFLTANAVVGSDGRAALAVDGGGRVAVIARRGRRLRAQEIDWAAVHATAAGMEVDARKLGRVLVAGVDHLDVRRLAPAGARRG